MPSFNLFIVHGFLLLLKQSFCSLSICHSYNIAMSFREIKQHIKVLVIEAGHLPSRSHFSDAALTMTALFSSTSHIFD